MVKISKWFDGYQAPAVLMIDDLSDGYIDIHKEPYKNDWGYLCDTEESAYTFLQRELLVHYPDIKITFFVPYARHNVINETRDNYKKYAVGEREAFTDFLKRLLKQGHEIAHHGSNHGRYIDPEKIDTANNFIHEWQLFESVEEGVAVTLKGKKVFREIVGTEVTGGKYCGYLQRSNSADIIDACGFEYWCIDAKLDPKESDTYLFGKNNVIAFPTNFNGNAFVRLKYKTGREKRDNLKRFTRFLQPLYNITQYHKLETLYKLGNIISIQEHISPATSSGSIQASNIVSDMESLQKIFAYLSKKSIWYATCGEIARYIYVRDQCRIEHRKNEIVIIFDNPKRLDNTKVTVESEKAFVLEDSDGRRHDSQKGDGKYFLSLSVHEGENRYLLLEGAEA